ncbi:hypothetical protein [Priestia endophytica]|jgi:phosphotransferase system HPr-like phosphotransfer protein|uniref:hypothetical protein n=1 Tax=Priestia endophytica TaxID=135735 RepID=UPI00227F0497|nr:hypothetical protein [Priestia endophytica]MCY8235519.1 hypothetical protein [Priestia endophytica]
MKKEGKQMDELRVIFYNKSCCSLGIMSRAQIKIKAEGIDEHQALQSIENHLNKKNVTD